MIKSIMTFKGEMAFEVELNGHKFTIDAESRVGGHDAGPRPKGLLLSSLGGCTGMDVVSILRKKKAKFDRFEVVVEGEVGDTHPKVYTEIRISYHIWGSNIDRKAVERSVELSQNKYCAISAMLKEIVPLKHEIIYHEI